MSTIMHRKDNASPGLKHRDFGFDIKKLSDSGTFEGYGSVFGVIDSYKEIVAPGAFAESLTSRKGALPVLWQHRSGEPIGLFTKAEEDKHGLWVEGKLLVDEVARAKEAYALMKAKVISGLSIGYYVRADSYDQKTGLRTLTKLDLIETSIVTFPANDDARVESVKQRCAFVEAFRAAGGKSTMAEFEKFLCEAGFSNTEAKAIAGGGFRQSFLREAGGKSNSEQMLDVLSGFKL